MGITILGSGRAVQRQRRHLRLRKRITGTSTRPRFVVTRSSRHMVAQIVDDTKGITLVSASSIEADIRALKADKTGKATAVGTLVAQRAKKAGITDVVFDRGGNKYHGRVAAVADAAREGGLSL
jgi:large subunit ribosomal protein L18